MKLRLTEARIPALRTNKPQEDLFHEPTPGAGLRITRRGRKTWFLLYSAPGSKQLRRVYLGEHPSGRLGSLSLRHLLFAPEIHQLLPRICCRRRSLC